MIRGTNKYAIVRTDIEKYKETDHRARNHSHGCACVYARLCVMCVSVCARTRYRLSLKCSVALYPCNYISEMEGKPEPSLCNFEEAF